jgi:hypothetical protein
MHGIGFLEISPLVAFLGLLTAAFTACSKSYCRNGFASVICCSGSMSGGSSAKPVANGQLYDSCSFEVMDALAPSRSLSGSFED